MTYITLKYRKTTLIINKIKEEEEEEDNNNIGDMNSASDGSSTQYAIPLQRFGRRLYPAIKTIFQLQQNLQASEASNSSEQTSSSTSPPSTISRRGMMPVYLADSEDYTEAIETHISARSFGSLQFVATSSSSEAVREAQTSVDYSRMTTKQIEIFSYKVNGTDSPSLGSFQLDEEVVENPRMLPMPTPTVFPIGAPSNLSSVKAEHHRRKGHHSAILNGYVQTLFKILQSEDEPPRFHDVFDSIRRYTASLAISVGPPLDDWNDLVQLVLRALHEKDKLSLLYADPEPFDFKLSRAFLCGEVDRCKLSIKDEELELEHVKERLARAREEQELLMAKLVRAQAVCLTIDSEAKAVEERMEQKRRRVAVCELFESVLSKFSSFQCGE